MEEYKKSFMEVSRLFNKATQMGSYNVDEVLAGANALKKLRELIERNEEQERLAKEANSLVKTD